MSMNEPKINIPVSQSVGLGVEIWYSSLYGYWSGEEILPSLVSVMETLDGSLWGQT
jgi:hypothetical protein